MTNRALKRAAGGLRRKGQFQRGLLGNAAGAIEVPGRPGYFYVRVEKPGGYEEGIFPGRVPLYLNLPVRIETHPITGVQFVAGVDDQTIAYSGVDPADIPDVGPHAPTHEWGGPDMVMWLHTMQLFPLRTQPAEPASQDVVVQGGTYFAEGQFSVLNSPQTVDLSAHVPGTGRRYVLLYLDAAGDVGIQDDDVSSLAALQPAPAGTFWLSAVRLRAGDVVGWQDIVDLRFMNSGVMNGGELELGDDYIVIGTGHPDLTGRWTRVGSQLDAFLDTAEATGMMAQTTTDYLFVGVDKVGTDEARASIIWGDNSDDLLWIAWYSMTGSKTYVATIDSAGDLEMLTGNIVMQPGATVDGVDVSEHTHSGVPGDGEQIDHSDLDNITADDHHTRYTDLEAEAVADTQIAAHAADADAHHDAFTEADHTAIADAAPHHAQLHDVESAADHETTETDASLVLRPDGAGGVAWGSVAEAFTDLGDTPASYAGNGGRVVTVNAGETGLEFTVGGGGGGGDSYALQINRWAVDGPLAVATEVDGVWRAVEAFTVVIVTMYLRDTGTAGSTIVDVDRSDNGGQTWTTLFTTPANRPELPAGQLDRRASNVPDVTAVASGDLLRVNIAQVADGARGLSAQLLGDIPEPGSISGRTFRSGNPEPGVTVEIYDSEDELAGSDISTADGRYRVDGLPPGLYRVEGEVDIGGTIYTDTLLDVEVLPGELTTGANLNLTST